MNEQCNKCNKPATYKISGYITDFEHGGDDVEELDGQS